MTDRIREALHYLEAGKKAAAQGCLEIERDVIRSQYRTHGLRLVVDNDCTDTLPCECPTTGE